MDRECHVGGEVKVKVAGIIDQNLMTKRPILAQTRLSIPLEIMTPGLGNNDTFAWSECLIFLVLDSC